MAINEQDKITVPFANSGLRNDIPETATGSNLASMQEGFPAITMTDIASGGQPPDGKDFNGILNVITKILQYVQSGGLYKYDSGYANAVNGYPKGALLLSSDGSKIWINKTDNNKSNPDNGGQNWGQIVDILEFSNNYLAKSGGTMTGGITFSQSTSIQRAGNTTSLVINGGDSNNNASLYLYGGGRTDGMTGRFELQARLANGSFKALQGNPSGSLTWAGNEVLTSASTLDASKLNVSYLPTAGGTATGQIKSTATKGFSIERAGEAFFTTKTTTGVGHSLSFGVGASGTSRGIYDEYQKHWILYKTSTGTVNIFAKGDGESDTAHVLTIGYDGTLTHRGHSILTDVSGLPLSGGTMTGGITFSQSTSIQRAGNTASLVINGGDSNNNASLYLHGGGRTDGMTGRFELQARLANGSFKALQGNPSGSLTWGGKNILREDTLCTTKPTTTSTASASNPAVVVENYYDSTTGNWYSVRSDGWVEQGGYVPLVATTQITVTIPYNMGEIHDSYHIELTPVKTDTNDFRPLSVKTDDAFSGGYSGNQQIIVNNYSKVPFYWKVSGFKGEDL